MVGAFLFHAVEEYANEFGLPVVYSGDRFQLPPVKDREVITDQGFETITLKSSMRFREGSEIFQLGEMLRHMIEHDPDGDLPMLSCSGGVSVVPGKSWIAELSQSYAARESLIAVTSKNKTLKRLRRSVRQVDHDRLTAGDLVRSKKTDGLFRNGEQFTISKIEAAPHVLPDVDECISKSRKLSISGHTVTFVETDKMAFIQHDGREAKNLAARVRRLHEVKKLDKAEAVRILDWLDEVNEFELSALSTVHKSQGRTVDTLYVDTDTVLKRPFWLSPRDHKRLLYTAITRARKQVIFYSLTGYAEARSPSKGAEIIPFHPRTPVRHSTPSEALSEPAVA